MRVVADRRRAVNTDQVRVIKEENVFFLNFCLQKSSYYTAD